MVETHEHNDSSNRMPQIKLIVVLLLPVMAFFSKILYTYYLAFCFLVLFLTSELSELGVKSNIKEGLRKTWYLFIISLFITPPIVWHFINLYLPDFWTHVTGRVGSGEFYQLILVGVIVVPFMEEIIFRGFLQEYLSSLTNDIISLVLSSALFAIVHWSSGIPLVVAVDLVLVFIDSLWFGIIYMKTRNTILSTLCHSMGNLTVILYIVFFLGIAM